MITFSRTASTIALLVLAAVVNRTSQGQVSEDDITVFLQREIVGRQLPQEEAQRFCDARVPRMPTVSSTTAWGQEAQRLRAAVLDQIVYRGRAVAWRDATTRVEWLETIPGGEGYCIKKLRFEALPGMWIPALLYEPEQLVGRVPAILNVNGHSPEGKVYKPKQMRCINQARRGMLALNVEWLGMGQLRTPGFDHASMNQLDLCGSSGLAPFFLSMRRALDVLLSLEHTDPERVGVTGLSGGGWQTIFISALDTRVKLSVPVAGYSSFLTRTRHTKDLGDSEQTPNDLATIVDYTHLTAMMAPRPTLLIYNAADDCCFESGYALGPLLAAAHPLFCLYERAGALRSHVNYDPGTHNYERNNREALYRMLHSFFCAGRVEFNDQEIPCQDELKTAEQLAVDLPETNEDFNTLARRLAAELPSTGPLPATRQEGEQWQQAARARLAEIVHAKSYEVTADEVSTDKQGDVTARFCRLKMSGEWTLPALILTPPEATKTALVLADKGRAGAGKQMAGLLSSGARVVAIDLFCLGESDPGPGKPPTGIGTLYALTVAAVGERPLGIQASQAAATARWVADQFPDGPLDVVCVGPRTSLIGLVTAALDQRSIHSVQLHGSLGSLKQVIEDNWSAREKPEFFCYGLLEAFDIQHLVALVAPRAVHFVDANERIHSELEDLPAWYRLWDMEFDPTVPIVPGT